MTIDDAVDEDEDGGMKLNSFDEDWFPVPWSNVR